MRILHVSSGNLYGGLETMLITIARFRHLCPVMEPTFAFSFEGRVTEELKAMGLPVYQLGNVRISRPWTIWRARRKLQRLICERSFDAVVCHSKWPLAIFGPVVKSSSLLVFWLHESTTGRHWLDTWTRAVTPDYAICNSRFTASELPKLFPKLSAKTISHPVDLDRPRPSAETRSRVRKEAHTRDDEIVIVQVSRMESWKGHLLHLRALALLRSNPAWTCWFVGGAQRPEEHDYLAKLRELAVNLAISERVRFLGERSDVPELLASADIFCQPNQEPEPFGISFIEALLASLPVVSTSIGGALEIIDSSCGILTAPNDVEALARALRALVESRELRQELGTSGPSRARGLCDPKTQLERVMEAIAENVTKPPRKLIQ